MASLQKPSHEARWLVVGAGIMGMTTAWLLAQSGRSVTLVEAMPQAGGLADSCRLEGISWDRFYHVILSTDEHLLGLLSSLGLSERLRFRRTRTGLQIGSCLRSVSTPLELLANPDIPWSAKLGLARSVMASIADTSAAELDAETAVNWLTRQSGSKAVELIWRPLLRSKLGEQAEGASALFIHSTLRRMYGIGAGRFGSGHFGYVEGGYAHIVAALESRLRQAGVQIRYNWPVSSIKLEGQKQHVSGPGRAQLEADRVVLTVPNPIAARLCPGLGRRLAGTDYMSVVCVSLLMDRPLTSFYVSNTTDEAAPFTGIIEMSNLVDRREFGGRHLVYLPQYLPAGHPRYCRDDNAISDDCIAYLERSFPGFSRTDVVAARVNRAQYVLADPHVGRIGTIPPVRTGIPGLFVVNSCQIVGGTLNVNETVRHAEDCLACLVNDDEHQPGAYPAVERWAAMRPWDDRLVTLEADNMIANLAREELLPHPDDACLDLGCGPGLAAQRLAARVERYVGLDVSLLALALARQRVGRAANVAFLPLNAANPQDLSIVSGQRFSYILCHSVIQYLPDEASLRRLLSSLRGVAAPNARIVIGDVPVRREFVGEALLLIAQATRAGALSQIFLGLTRRLFDRDFWRATRRGIAFPSTARLAEAASAAGFTAEIRPARGRPPGRRVLLLCRPKPKGCES